MQKPIKFAAILATITLVAACSKPQEEEYVVVEQPAPISVEPTYSGKYN